MSRVARIRKCASSCERGATKRGKRDWDSYNACLSDCQGQQPKPKSRKLSRKAAPKKAARGIL